MKKGNWQEWEDSFIKENYKELGTKKCAEHLDRSYHSVQARATKKLNVRNYEHRKWTEEEKHFLRDNYPDKLGHYCADKLNRSFHATHKMVEKLGIKPNWKYRYLTKEGYWMLCHDRENKILEHRHVIQQELGRELSSDEIVHHIDGDKLNNKPSNLVITNRSEHARHHGVERGGLNTRDSLNS